MRNRKRAVLLSLVFLGLSSPARAQVTVQPNEAPNGRIHKLVIRVQSWRDDADTVRVEVRFPELPLVLVQPHQGWDIDIHQAEPRAPLDLFGQEVTKVVDRVVWSGGRIEPGQFEEFGLVAKLPDSPTALDFPTVQTFSSGRRVFWVGSSESRRPAAKVTVLSVPVTDDFGQLSMLVEAYEASKERSRDVDGSFREDNSTERFAVALAAVSILVAAVAVALNVRLTSRLRR